MQGRQYVTWYPGLYYSLYCRRLHVYPKVEKKGSNYLQEGFTYCTTSSSRGTLPPHSVSSRTSVHTAFRTFSCTGKFCSGLASIAPDPLLGCNLSSLLAGETAIPWSLPLESHEYMRPRES